MNNKQTIAKGVKAGLVIVAGYYVINKACKFGVNYYMTHIRKEENDEIVTEES